MSSPSAASPPAISLARASASVAMAARRPMTAALWGDTDSFPIGDSAYLRKIASVPHLVIATLVQAVSIIWRRAILIEIAGIRPGDDAEFLLAKLSNILDNFKIESTANAHPPC
jgi:hypothetical protein